ncbi:MAG TPA: hydrogenase [Thermoanaerobaculia bacterium]|nr:hydrogenase [Thermoanaerobaculia bacterium]
MSALARLARLEAGGALPRAALLDLPWPDFAAALLDGVAGGLRVVAYFGAAEAGGVRLYLVLADDPGATLAAGTTAVRGGSFPSLAERCPQVHLFEREIAEQHGVRAEGHPWPKPVRFQPPVTDFYRVDGAEVHEVGVGPVHAGVIEPGHFRFQCHGEEVFHLEISLGYQHRGIERALVGGPDRRSVHLLETAAGDTTIGHATAYCEVVEALADRQPADRGSALRAIALELERLASHAGDLGALAGDVGYLPTASYCGRIRGDFLNLTADLCGSRFGRGLVRPGGARFDADEALAGRLRERLERAVADCRSAVELLWDAPSVMERFEGTGTVPRAVAEALGVKGPAARASGLDRDARRDHPSGVFRAHPVPVALADSGDVYARARVRWLEIERSAAFVLERLADLPGGPARSEAGGALGASRLAASLVEGWRGELCHVALTDEAGRFARYKVVDPSFHNWSALAYALRGQQISDFPLCNKSFNLSYSGHDL